MKKGYKKRVKRGQGNDGNCGKKTRSVVVQKRRDKFVE